MLRRFFVRRGFEKQRLATLPEEEAVLFVLYEIRNVLKKYYHRVVQARANKFGKTIGYIDFGGYGAISVVVSNGKITINSDVPIIVPDKELEPYLEIIEDVVGDYVVYCSVCETAFSIEEIRGFSCPKCGSSLRRDIKCVKANLALELLGYEIKEKYGHEYFRYYSILTVCIITSCTFTLLPRCL